MSCRVIMGGFSKIMPSMSSKVAPIELLERLPGACATGTHVLLVYASGTQGILPCAGYTSLRR